MKREREAHGGGADSFSQRAGLGQQRADAGPGGVVEHLQPEADYVAVLAREGHDVGHRAGGDEVGVLLEHARGVALHGAQQLEGHAHAREVGVGIAAVRPLGVDHGHGIGQGAGPALVVVGDDHVHAQRGGVFRLLRRGYAAVHRYYEARAPGFYGVHGREVQAVALLHAVRYVGLALQALGAQPAGHEAGGGDAVHVVVAEHGDGLALLYRPAHARRGLVHVLQQHRVAQKLRPAVQEALRLLRRPYPPPAQQRREQRGIARLSEGRRYLRPLRRYIPITVIHKPYAPLRGLLPFPRTIA